MRSPNSLFRSSDPWIGIKRSRSIDRSFPMIFQLRLGRASMVVLGGCAIHSPWTTTSTHVSHRQHLSENRRRCGTRSGDPSAPMASYGKPKPKSGTKPKRCASPAINLPQLPVFPGFRFGFIFRESTLAMWPASRVSCHKECGFLVPNRKHGPSAQLSMAAKEFPFTLPTPVWRIEDQAQPAHAIIPPCSEPACSL